MQRAFEKIVFHLLKILKSTGSKSDNLVLFELCISING